MVKNSQFMVKNRLFVHYTHFYLFFTKKYSLLLAARITFRKRKGR